MFGFVCIDKPELKIKEYETYKSVYCGLCKRLGKDYSFLLRFILNYDCTFYALLCMSKLDTSPCYEKRCCRFNPLKSCSYCTGEAYEEALSKAAALLVIMTYYKVLDNIEDSGLFKRLFMRLLKPFFSSARKKASKKYPEFDAYCAEMLSSQLYAEKNNLSLDECAEPTAKLLANVFSLKAESEADKRVYYEFGYHLGRWVYLMDAACDLDDDIKKKSFNPIYNKYKEGLSECAEECDAIISQSLYRLTKAYELMNFRRYKPILDNIILLGLAKKQKEILTNVKGKSNE